MINPTDTIFVGIFRHQGDGAITIYSIHHSEKAMIDHYSGWEGFNNGPIWLPNDYSMEELEEQDNMEGADLGDDHILIEYALPYMLLCDHRNNKINDPYGGIIQGFELTCAQLNRMMEEQEA